MDGFEQVVWPTVGQSGRVPLWALIPSPDQPRKHFDEAELEALAKTMKKERGGQRDVMTVTPLTAGELEQYVPARYKIVGGERRFKAAPKAGLTELEVRVKAYASDAHRRLDMFMLNENRVGLSDIENADYLEQLTRDFGWTTQEEITVALGKPTRWVFEHQALLRIAPRVRFLMSPDISKQERLKRHVGVFLSRLSFETQDDFAQRMPKGDRVTATQQIRWMQDQLRETGEKLPTRRLLPSTIRRIMGYYADQVERRAGELIAYEELPNLFENASREQVIALRARMMDARVAFNRLFDRVDELYQEALRKDEAAPANRSRQPIPPAQTVREVTEFIRVEVSKPASRPEPPVPLMPDTKDDIVRQVRSQAGSSTSRYTSIFDDGKKR